MVGSAPSWITLLVIVLLVLDGASAFVATRTEIPRPTAVSSCVRRGVLPLPARPSSSSFCFSSRTCRSTTSTTRLQAMPLPPSALVAASADAAAAGEMTPIVRFLVETLIVNGVPALFTILVIAFAAKSIGGAVREGRKGRGDEFGNKKGEPADSFSPLSMLYDDMYGDQAQEQRKGGGMNNFPFPPGLFPQQQQNNNRSLPKNTGVPKRQYLTLTHWNPKLDSYRYSVMSATNGRATAAADYRQRARSRIFRQYLDISPSQWRELQTLESEYLRKASVLERELQILRQKANLKAVDEAYKRLGLNVTDPYQLDPSAASTSGNTTTSTWILVDQKSSSSTSTPNVVATDIGQKTAALQQLEVAFVQAVTTIVGPAQAPLVRAAVVGDRIGSTGERPLTKFLFQHHDIAPTSQQQPPQKKRMFIARFPGDALASQVDTLRQEVTGILLAASAGRQSDDDIIHDEALIVLQSGGGTVTGYGLAAAQLQRLKSAGIPLTIAVEQVAASGGYMMACIADRIVASPFAVLGSIGVISDIPNVYERLKSEGIEFQTVTAGKYKRTLTPTKKVTKEDLQKSKEDIEEVYVLFRDFVAKNRPQLNIDEVATGETWFGSDALERKLCDEIKTVDEIILERVASGYDVYEIKYKPPGKLQTPLGTIFRDGDEEGQSSAGGGSGDGGWIDSAVQWAVRRVMTSVNRALLDQSLSPTVEQRYMAKDDTADRINSRS